MVSKAQSLPPTGPAVTGLSRGRPSAIVYSLYPVPRRLWQTGGSNLTSGASDKPKATKVLNPLPHLQFQRQHQEVCHSPYLYPLTPQA